MNSNRTYMEELLRIVQLLSVEDLNAYLTEVTTDVPDAGAVCLQLDQFAAKLQSHALTFLLLVRQRHVAALNTKANLHDSPLYTKQEVAARYRVSVRTIHNWIAGGLQTVEMGGVLRISASGLEKFVVERKLKKPAIAAGARKA